VISGEAAIFFTAMETQAFQECRVTEETVTSSGSSATVALFRGLATTCIILRPEQAPRTCTSVFGSREEL